MQEVYDSLQLRLNRLRRNEAQMTPEMRKKYEANLAAYRKQISSDADELIRKVTTTDLPILDDDIESEVQIIQRINTITSSQWWKEYAEKSKQILFTTWSVLLFLDRIERLKTEILYKAYGPYWASKTVIDYQTREITNILEDIRLGGHFIWNIEKGQWEEPGIGPSPLFLPPTMDLLKKSYMNITHQA